MLVFCRVGGFVDAQSFVSGLVSVGGLAACCITLPKLEVSSSNQGIAQFIGQIREILNVGIKNGKGTEAINSKRTKYWKKLVWKGKKVKPSFRLPESLLILMARVTLLHLPQTTTNISTPAQTQLCQ